MSNKKINYIQNIHEQKTVTNSEKYTLQLFTYDVLEQLLLPCMVLPKNVQICHTLAGRLSLSKNRALWIMKGKYVLSNYDGNTYIKKVYPNLAGLQLVSINKNHHDFFYLGLKDQ